MKNNIITYSYKYNYNSKQYLLDIINGAKNNTNIKILLILLINFYYIVSMSIELMRNDKQLKLIK
jgi:hypothetical protein